METERIDLGDGQWWEIRTRLTRAIEKAVTRASLAAIPRLDPSENADEESVKSRLLAQIGAVDIGAIEDAYLLHGTVAYSFGQTVTMETIDALPADTVRRVITRMFELYNPQRVDEDEKKDSLRRLSPVT